MKEGMAGINDKMFWSGEVLLSSFLYLFLFVFVLCFVLCFRVMACAIANVDD